jgi:hypothetical protein
MHFMNPQRASHMQAPQQEQPLVQLGPGSANTQDGTAASGYATPDLGPFECENCKKYDPQGQPPCQDPRVQADPEVKGQVDAEGCCNFFKSAHNESQQEEHSESESAPESENEE